MAYNEKHIEQFKILLRKYPNEHRQRQLRDLCLREYGWKPSLGKVNEWLNKFGNLKKVSDKKTERKFRKKDSKVRQIGYSINDPEIIDVSDIVIGVQKNGLTKYSKEKNELVFIYYTKGYTLQRISEILNINIDTVKTTIYRDKYKDGKTMKQLYDDFLKEGMYDVRNEIRQLVANVTINGIYRASIYDRIKTEVYESYYNMKSDKPDEQKQILKEKAFYISNIAPKTTDALTQELMGVIEFSEKVDMADIVKDLAEETGIDLDAYLNMIKEEEEKKKKNGKK